MGITIRYANTPDAGAIALICSDDLGYSCSDTLVRAKLSGIDKSREAVFVADFDGKVIGYVHVEKYDTLYMETLANILGLAVRNDSRRLGAGRMLMKTAEDWAMENGAVGVRLNSGGQRKEAHAFYRAVGYLSEKEQLRFLKMF